MKTVLILISAVGLALPDETLNTLLPDADEATMVILDQTEQSFIILNEKRAAVQYSPFSTHKIPHSIIVLEAGLVPSIDSPLYWDKETYPQEDWWPKSWMGNHTLRSAIRVSLVPAYRDLARKAGTEMMKDYLHRFSYGNADLSSGLDGYWLNGSLKISAMEQVYFLRAFYHDQLGLKRSTTQGVKEILVRDQTAEFIISYKTGTGIIDYESGRALAWLVGYIEKNESVYFFAFNMHAANFEEAVAERLDTAMSIFKQAGLMD
jgi:beta-lactamase class D